MNCPKCNTPLVNGVCPNCQNNDNIDVFDDFVNQEPQEQVSNVSLVQEEVPLENVAKKKKGFKIKLNVKASKLYTLVLLILCFLIGLFIGKSFFSKTIVTRSVTTVNKDTLKSDGSKNTTNIDGVTYQIPTNYIYDKTLNGVLIYDKDDTFRIFIRCDDGSYSIMTSSLTSIKETLKTKDITINNIKEVDIDSKKAIAIEGTTKLVNRLIAYTESGKDHIFYIEIVTSDNSFNYDVLKLAIEILKDTKVEKSISKMESIDVYDISDLAITAANTYNKLK